MITRTRTIILFENEQQREHLQRFEAITVVDNLRNDVLQEVWSNNKTPAIKESNTKNVKIDTNMFLVEDFLKESVIDKDQLEEFAIACHKAGFEPGEYITEKRYDTSKERCVLCEIASYKGMRNSLAYYNAHVEKEVDCIIYESRFFYVTSELGALVPGFLMIIPKEHYLSVAQFDKCILSDYEQVCNDIEQMLKGAFGENKPVIFFEHGSSPSGMSSHKKSIVHAHTHVVVGYTLENKYLNMVKMKPITDITIAKHTHYFSYQEGATGQLFIAMDPKVYVQRQYPRQILAEQIGLAPGQYNWRNVEFSENTKATLYRLYMYLTSENVPSRIAERTSEFIEGYQLREDFRIV